MSAIIHDPYQLRLMTMGFGSTYVTGQRVVFEDGMPIRQNLSQQYDPMEWQRWSYDTNCEAMRMYVQNDCAVGHNIYLPTSTLIFLGTTPQVTMYVNATTCNLCVSVAGTIMREWGVHANTWAQVNSGSVSRRGVSLGENGSWLLGYIADGSFGMLARRHQFEDWHKGSGYSDVWAELTSVDETGELQDADYVGRGALYFGTNNDYRLGVNRAGRACIWQKDVLTKLYSVVERF